MHPDCKVRSGINFRNYRLMSRVISVSTGSIYFLSIPNIFAIKIKGEGTIDGLIWFEILTNLPWLAKPLFGFLADIFSPFKKKMKSYIILLSIISIFAMIKIIFLTSDEKFDYSNFRLNVCILQFAYGMIDALGEGLCVVLTQVEIKKNWLLKEIGIERSLGDQLVESESANSQKSLYNLKSKIKRIDFARFYLLREFVRCLSKFLGGFIFSPNYFGNRHDKDFTTDELRGAYIAFLAMPISLLIFTAFFFREVKVYIFFN